MKNLFLFAALVLFLGANVTTAFASQDNVKVKTEQQDNKKCEKCGKEACSGDCQKAGHKSEGHKAAGTTEGHKCGSAESKKCGTAEGKSCCSSKEKAGCGTKAEGTKCNHGGGEKK